MELSIYELVMLYQAMRNHEKAMEKIWLEIPTNSNMYIMEDFRKLCDKVLESLDSAINN